MCKARYRNLLVVAAAALVAGPAAACSIDRLVATPAPKAPMTVSRFDDAAGNGRLWSARPIVRNGPAAVDTGNPGAEAYGAYGQEDQWVWVRVGATAVAIRPWQVFTIGGMANFERARQQWLEEQGYTGGVRTFRKTAPARHPEIIASLPQPRATIQVPEGARAKRGFHVDSGRALDAATRLAALKSDNRPVRISWPMNAPAQARARTDATGGYLILSPILTARVEP